MCCSCAFPSLGLVSASSHSKAWRQLRLVRHWQVAGGLKSIDEESSWRSQRLGESKSRLVHTCENKIKMASMQLGSGRGMVM